MCSALPRLGDYGKSRDDGSGIGFLAPRSVESIFFAFRSDFKALAPKTHEGVPLLEQSKAFLHSFHIVVKKRKIRPKAN